MPGMASPYFIPGLHSHWRFDFEGSGRLIYDVGLLTRMPMIEAILTNEDYQNFHANCDGQFKSRSSIYYWVILALGLALTFLVVAAKSNLNTLLMVISGIGITILLSHTVRNRMFADEYGKWYGEKRYFNTGAVIYELKDDHIQFEGTTFNATIPYSNISKIVEVNGYCFLAFHCQNAFLLPHQDNIKNGDYTEFKGILASKIAQQGD